MKQYNKMTPLPQNPLTKFRAANPRWTWEDMAKEVGTSSTTLIKMSTKEKDALLTMYVGTYFAIKNKLGIDMIDDFGDAPYEPYDKDEKSS